MSTVLEINQKCLLLLDQLDRLTGWQIMQAGPEYHDYYNFLQDLSVALGQYELRAPLNAEILHEIAGKIKTNLDPIVVEEFLEGLMTEEVNTLETSPPSQQDELAGIRNSIDDIHAIEYKLTASAPPPVIAALKEVESELNKIVDKYPEAVNNKSARIAIVDDITNVKNTQLDKLVKACETAHINTKPIKSICSKIKSALEQLAKSIKNMPAAIQSGAAKFKAGFFNKERDEKEIVREYRVYDPDAQSKPKNR